MNYKMSIPSSDERFAASLAHALSHIRVAGYAAPSCAPDQDGYYVLTTVDEIPQDLLDHLDLTAV